MMGCYIKAVLYATAFLAGISGGGWLWWLWIKWCQEYSQDLDPPLALAPLGVIAFVMMVFGIAEACREEKRGKKP
jgi:hypothetical protein